ncbi:MAG TPA: dethiobiotin synthase [Xanthobacteraceae bacterium]|nr:dethiobiotin synthase [Xanthobacteraceae bacterium]
MSAFFITATGTDVGKTFVARGLIRALRARGRVVAALKPIVSGFEPAEAAGSDGGLLLAALGREPTLEAIAEISPWRFRAPLSPDMAAAREKRKLDYPRLIEFCRAAIAADHDCLLIEGIGGLMSPADSDHTMLDWMKALRLPVILVGGSYLGTISHTLTALDTLARHELAVTALVISESAGSPVRLDETRDTIARFAPKIDIITVPRLPASTPEHAGFDRLVQMIP